MSKPVLFHSHLAAVLAGVSYGVVVLGELGLALRTLGAGFGGANRGGGWGITLGVGLGVLLGVRAAHGVPSLTLPGSGWWPFVLGLGLIWTGLALRWWAVVVLGRFFQITLVVQEGHRVVDTGPYRLVRHPSYSGLLLVIAGIGFTLGNWLSVASCLILPVLGVLPRIRSEEAFLERNLGDPYRIYAARTRRLVPRVW